MYGSIMRSRLRLYYPQLKRFPISSKILQLPYYLERIPAFVQAYHVIFWVGSDFPLVFLLMLLLRFCDPTQKQPRVCLMVE